MLNLYFLDYFWSPTIFPFVGWLYFSFVSLYFLPFYHEGVSDFLIDLIEFSKDREY